MKEKIFSTKDLPLASLCYAKGERLLEVKREGRVCWFIFENQNKCSELQKKYFSKSIEVNAKEYSDAIRTLKDLVFSV